MTDVASLASVDLVVDQEYGGGKAGHAGDEPIHWLLGVSNQGGFRYLGRFDALEMLVLFSSFDDPDWPDSIDNASGMFSYFGDNKKPGRELHKTPRRGNLILQDMFNHIHSDPPRRSQVPPIFVFARGSAGRSVVFRGLAIPGAIALPQTLDLVAVWKSSDGRRYQNYHAVFTLLDVAKVTRRWILDIQAGQPMSDAAPEVWKQWKTTGVIRPLRAVTTRAYRTKEEQLPRLATEQDFLRTIYERYVEFPYDFEFCAGEITRLHLANVVSIDFTPPRRDGGRDALGKYNIGSGRASVLVDFAIEAKCYAPDNPVGVSGLSRLISRLRHRQFGVLVTTSYLHKQAYEEIIDDSHPIVVISGRDIVEILHRQGIASQDALVRWLQSLSTHSVASTIIR